MLSGVIKASAGVYYFYLHRRHCWAKGLYGFSLCEDKDGCGRSGSASYLGFVCVQMS